MESHRFVKFEMEHASIYFSVMETKHYIKEICGVPAVDRPTEKVLGRNLWEIGFERSKPFAELLFLVNTNVSPNPSTDRNPKTFEVRSVCRRFGEIGDAPAAEWKGVS